MTKLQGLFLFFLLLLWLYELQTEVNELRKRIEFHDDASERELDKQLELCDSDQEITDVLDKMRPL